jgi:hypothetical protein
MRDVMQTIHQRASSQRVDETVVDARAAFSHRRLAAKWRWTPTADITRDLGRVINARAGAALITIPRHGPPNLPR